MVGEIGLEPTRVASPVPKTGVSTIPPLALVCGVCKGVESNTHTFILKREVLRILFVYRQLLGPPVSNTIRVNMVANTTMSMPTISLPGCLRLP